MHFGMLFAVSTQIAVRLPDSMVIELDRAVSTGRASSRTAVVQAALARELRRIAAEHDAEILRQTGPADDLDDLVRWASSRIPPED
jgi:Arc/MetJ-type ribon-helix-helix transcriptional regulator